MSFLEAGTKYLKTIESYDRLSAVEKIEANHLLLAYEELMKDDCYRLCLTDLHLLLRLLKAVKQFVFKTLSLLTLFS